jgi:ubiquinone/menaquinone biosynthesis C-methylase UbiE
MLSRSSLKLKFGWTWRFLFVWILQMYLKSRAHLFRRPDDYRAHQKDFFKLRILEDGSDKFHAVRRRIASYAHDSGSHRALDVATGHGFQAMALKQMGMRLVIGIDLVVERIAYCKRTYSCDPPLFAVMDASRLSFPDKMFDCTTVCAVLHDMPRAIRKEAISEIARVTKSRIVIFEPRNFRSALSASVYGVLGELLDESLHFRQFAKDDLIELITEIGLEVLTQETAWYNVMQIVVCKVN